MVTHPAQIILPGCDDDRPPDDRVRPDKPHHPILQVHLAHAGIVRVDVPCKTIFCVSTQK